MALSHITDHAERARARLVTQFRSTVSHGALLDVLSRQVQEVEDMLYSLLSTTVIDSSAGVQLDRLGKVLKVPRNAHTDAQFRAYLKAQILVNRSSGTVPEILEILRVVLAAYDANVVEWTSYRPAAFIVRVVGAIGAAEPAVLADLVRQARDGGVLAFLTWCVAADAESFRFAHDWTAAHETTLNAGIAAGVSSFTTAVLPGSWGDVPLFAYIDRGEDVCEVVKVSEVATTLSAGTFTLVNPTVFAHSNGAAVELAPPQGFGTGHFAGVKEA